MAMRSFGERMLRDLAAVSRGRPGVQHELRATGERAGLNVTVTLDPEFEALYGKLDSDEAAKMMKAGPTDSVVEAWERRPLHEMTRALARIESEADLAGIHYPRWSPYLCTELAKRVSDPVAVAEAFLDHELPADLVGPFVLQASTTNQPRWPALVDRCLDTADYRILGIHAVVTHDAPPSEILATALREGGSFPQQIEAFCLRREVPSDTLKKMFCFTDARVAVAAAIGYWCGHCRATDGACRPPDGWRQAILRAPAHDALLSQHEKYWLGEILLKNRDLAADWLVSKFGQHDRIGASWKVERIAVKIVSALDLGQRAGVLAAVCPSQHAEGLVKHLVADDLELYRDLLRNERLERFHLSPLAGKPEGAAWRAKALLALEKGFTIEDIVRAALGRSHSWSGLESEMWAGWRRSFCRAWLMMPSTTSQASAGGESRLRGATNTGRLSTSATKQFTGCSYRHPIGPVWTMEGALPSLRHPLSAIASLVALADMKAITAPRGADTRMKKQKKKNVRRYDVDLSFVSDFLGRLLANTASNLRPREIFSGRTWIRQDEGMLTLDSGEYRDYKDVRGELIKRLAPEEDISATAIESSLQDAIFAAVDICKRRDSNTDSRISAAVRSLRELNDRPSETFECWIEVRGLAASSLPSPFGRVRFAELTMCQIHDLSRRIGPNSSAFLTARSERLEGNCFAVLESEARDIGAAIELATREVQATVECLNFFSDMLDFNSSWLYLPGDHETTVTTKIAIGDGGQFAAESKIVGPRNDYNMGDSGRRRISMT